MLHRAVQNAYQDRDPKITHFFASQKYPGVPIWAVVEVLTLGAETAQSLGLPVRRIRAILLVLAAALAGAAVSFCGLLGFVGLIVPHMARRLAGESGPGMLCASALGGALLLSLCDLIARTVAAPYVLPVGVVMSFVGGPFFIWLLFRQKGGRRG